MDRADLTVIGAGLYGITATITYHRLHPRARILLLESSPYVGGPWAPHRIFPGLKTNNLWGTYEHPDFPMDEGRFGVKRGEHVPAENMAAYMAALIEDNNISACVKVNTRVDIVEQTNDGWILHCTSENAGQNTALTIDTAKLIVALGHVSRPSMPRYPTSPEFRRTVIHSIDFPSHFSNIAKPDSHTLVIGGGKSAWDVAYTCATQPFSTATMLIRPSGNGPMWTSPAHVTPFRLWFEKLALTRFFGFLAPCPWAEASGFEGWTRRFLHRTRLGRVVVKAFWGALGADIIRLNKLEEHPETRKLRPWKNTFDLGNAPSILTYPTSFFDLVKEGRIKIIIDEVSRFEGDGEVLLKGGKTLRADAVVCATGWKAGGTLKFKPASLERELGLPSTGETDVGNIALAEKVEADLYVQFPFLEGRDASRAHHPAPELRYAPSADGKPIRPTYRLYRFLVPPSDFHRRSIGFAGVAQSLSNASCAYLQSIWLAAYLDGSISLPPTSIDQLEYDLYRDTQYCALRSAMAYGNKFPDLVFDSLPYFDSLIRDIGLQWKRKRSVLGWANEIVEYFSGYRPQDYKGLLAEWQNRQSRIG